MKIFTILLLLLTSLIAEDKYSLRAAYGKATMSDFSEIIVGNWKGHPNDLYVYALDAGYLLAKDYKDYPVDFYAKAGLAYYDEDDMRDNVIEGTIYIKAYWKFDVLDRGIRLGLGEGFSYTSAVLYTEWLEAYEENDHNSKFLNYLDVSLDVDLGKLFSYKEMEGVYLGWSLKHRSGIFGLINNVRRGGSNYNTFSIEMDF